MTAGKSTDIWLQGFLVLNIHIWQGAMHMQATSLATLCCTPDANLWHFVQLARVPEERRAPEDVWNIRTVL